MIDRQHIRFKSYDFADAKPVSEVAALEKLQSEHIAARSTTLSGESRSLRGVAPANAAGKNYFTEGYDPVTGKTAYKPNSVPVRERLARIALSAALVLFAVIALLADDFWIPTGKANSGPGIHLHGTAVWIMGGAIVCACVVILCTVVDHYDKRDNEHVYKTVEMLFTVAGFGAFFSALILHALTIMTG